jgi:hypothetical protein
MEFLSETLKIGDYFQVILWELEWFYSYLLYMLLEFKMSSFRSEICSSMS